MKKIICKDLEGRDYETEVDKLTFRPAVYGVIIEDGKILLSKQWDGYDFPGGGIELGETIDEALKREVKEETGLSIDLVEIIDAKASFFKIPENNNMVHSILIYYLCKVTGGNLATEYLAEDEKESLQLAEWIDLDKTSSIKFISTINSLGILNRAKKLL